MSVDRAVEPPSEQDSSPVSEHLDRYVPEKLDNIKLHVSSEQVDQRDGRVQVRPGHSPCERVRNNQNDREQYFEVNVGVHHVDEQGQRNGAQELINHLENKDKNTYDEILLIIYYKFDNILKINLK